MPARNDLRIVPSQFPEVEAFPALRDLFSRQVDMQFADLHAALRLPIEDIDPDVGLNLTTAALIFSLVAGASVLLHNPDWRAFKTGAASGNRFESALVAAYPWSSDDDVAREVGAALLYEWARNPLVHSLGIGKDRRAIPGAPGVRPYDRIVFVKWALSAEQVLSLSRGDKRRPLWLPATVLRVGDSIELSVPTMAWGVHVMWRELIASHGPAAEGIASRLLRRPQP